MYSITTTSRPGNAKCALILNSNVRCNRRTAFIEHYTVQPSRVKRLMFTIVLVVREIGIRASAQGRRLRGTAQRTTQAIILSKQRHFL